MRIQLLITLCLVASTLGLNRIVAKGNKFFDEVTGQQFFIKGVDYQPVHQQDPLADLTGLKIDIPLLQAAGFNTLRIYQIDVSVDHTTAMNLLNDAGIYVLFDASDPAYSITNKNTTWDLTLLNFYKQKADSIRGFTNSLGMLAGNEVINGNGTETLAAAFVKAAVRDLKSYLASVNSKMLVGYAATDIPSINVQLQAYLACGASSTAVDFYGINTYRWCNNATVKNTYTAAYSELATYASQISSIPYIFTEYGCNTDAPRTFDEVVSIYGSDANGYLSGGFVFEWSQKANNYGLVQINSDGTRTTLADYNTIKARLTNSTVANLTTSFTLSNFNPSAVTVNCPSVDSVFESASSPLPPTPSDSYCSCVLKALSCVSVYTNASMNYDVSGPVGTACGTSGVSCTDINTNSNTGVYGKVSGCNYLQRASYAYTQYYQAKKGSGGMCAFTVGGSNQAKLNPSVSGTVAACDAAIASTSSSSSQSIVVTQSDSNGNTFTGSSAAAVPTSSQNSGNAAIVLPFAVLAILPMII